MQHFKGHSLHTKIKCVANFCVANSIARMCRGHNVPYIYILLRSVGYLFIHRILLRVQLDIDISTERMKFNFFYFNFFLDNFFLTYSHYSIDTLPISIIDRERTTLKWSDRHRTNSRLVRSVGLTR